MLNKPALARNFIVSLNFLVILAILLVAGFSPADVQALGPIVVNTVVETHHDSLCSLREAIINANANSQLRPDCNTGAGNDVIVFSDALGVATIVLPSSLPDITDLNGLTIDGGGDITISGNNLYRVFVVNNRVPITLNRLTVTRGNGLSVYYGGGIYNNGGDVLITNSTFHDNRAGNGGGVYNNRGNLTITNSTFSSNSAGINVPANNDGGGIHHNGGVLTVTNSTFSSNWAYSQGGGIYVSFGSTTITNSTFSKNLAYVEGGGIYVSSGTTTIKNSTFSENGNVAIWGGGIYAASGTLTIDKSTFSGNAANLGAGVFVWSGTSAITNSTFSGNSSNQGGGVKNLGTITIKNSTFSGNSSTSGVGAGISNDGTLNLFNTILANSTTGPDCFTNPGSPVAGNNNLIETDSLSPNACGTGALSGDPNLGVLISSPAYLPLNSGSPAINAGDSAICAAAPVSNTSQNGVPRYQGYRASCDIGSYEVQTPWIPSPADSIDVLNKAVNGLIDTGAISVDNGKILLSMLDDSIQALDKGDTDSVIKALSGFIEQVNLLIKSGELEPTDGQPLIDGTQAIIDSIR